MILPVDAAASAAALPAQVCPKPSARRPLTQWGGSPIGYDANGNMTSDSTKTYGWDARNHLASIGRGVTASFQYDPFGRRVSKSVGGSATSYLYDGGNAVQELSGAAPTANLLNGALDEVLTRSVATGTSSYLADALGSTVALADNVGVIQSQYNYEPFGQTTVSGVTSHIEPLKKFIRSGGGRLSIKATGIGAILMLCGLLWAAISSR